MHAIFFPMELTWKMVLIVPVGVFLASVVDGIAGGGGMISLPAYFLAGLPAHLALGTNKLSSCIGTSVSAGRFIRGGFVDWKLAAPSAVLAIIGSYFGTKLQLAVDERYLKWLLVVILPLVAVVVLRQHSFPEERGDIAPGKQMAIVLLASLVIGTYDGFYGPGTGTFLILIFCNLAKLDLRTASGNVKVVNLSSNIGGVTTALLNGKVFVALGLLYGDFGRVPLLMVFVLTAIYALLTLRGLPLESRIQEFQANISQELQQQQNQLQAPIYEKANKAVQELAKAKGLTALFDATQALYFDESKVIDLTPEARKALGIAEGRTLETLQAELQEKAQAAQQQAQ